MYQPQHYTLCATATRINVCHLRQMEWFGRKDLLSFLPRRMPVPGMFVAKACMLLLCCILFVSKSFCQDVITRTDSVRIEANILKVENNQILYKLYANPEGSDYMISTSDVLFVEYADGTRRVFNQPVAQQLTAGTDYETGLGRNIISFSLKDLLFLNATLAYERISASGKFGIRVPLSVGLDPDEQYIDYYKRNNIFSAGIALNLYPFGQSRFNYYLGPQAELSFIKYQTYDFTIYDPDNPYPETVLRTQELQILSVILNNGIFYQLSKTFVTALDVGVGVRFINGTNDDDAYDNYPYYLDRFFVPVNLLVGIRF